MEDLWGPIEQAQWQSTPCVRHRQATEQDVREGRAVFHVNGAVAPAEIDLPACAYQRLEDESEQSVVVVQAEILPDGTLLGVRPLSGGNGICFASEVRLLPGGFE